MSHRPKSREQTVRRILLVLALAALTAASSTVVAQPLPGQPAERIDFPVNSPGIPAYARLELLLPNFDVPNNKHWAAIVFYRDPACVPEDFNLGSFFHPPGPDGLGAFACPLLIEGHELWTNGPADDTAPRYVVSRNAVPKLPVWFVAWRELESPFETGSVTIEDLRNMPSLQVGYAHWFEERLYPNGGADEPGIALRASGKLQNGRNFLLSWNYADFGDVDEVVIRFWGRANWPLIRYWEQSDWPY